MNVIVGDRSINFGGKEREGIDTFQKRKYL
jgi:hypothetical protein